MWITSPLSSVCCTDVSWRSEDSWFVALLEGRLAEDEGRGDAILEAYSSVARYPICSSGVLTASREVPVVNFSFPSGHASFLETYRSRYR